MAWEYLRTPEFDKRAEWVADGLTHTFTGATLLDLNCGHAPLYRLLRARGELPIRYLGNDVDTEYLPKADRKATFYGVIDPAVVPIIQGAGITIDILVVMGYYDYDAEPNNYESPTLNQTIERLAQTEPGPREVVIECSHRCAEGAMRVAGMFGLPHSSHEEKNVAWSGRSDMAWLARRFIARLHA